MFETGLFDGRHFSSIIYLSPILFRDEESSCGVEGRFHQFEPFRIFSSVFSCCIARDSRAAFFSRGRCSPFGAFECDNDAIAFAFGHNDSVYFWE